MLVSYIIPLFGIAFIRNEYKYLVKRFSNNDRYFGRLILDITDDYANKIQLREVRVSQLVKVLQLCYNGTCLDMFFACRSKPYLKITPKLELVAVPVKQPWKMWKTTSSGFR